MIRAFWNCATSKVASLAFTGLLVANPILSGQSGGFPPPLSAQPNQTNANPLNPQQQKVQKLLAIHRALSDAQDLLRRGQNVDAVTVLERELAQIEGDREYLRTLQDAYHGAIQDLARSGNAVEADMYLKRLAALQAPIPTAPVSTSSPQGFPADSTKAIAGNPGTANPVAGENAPTRSPNRVQVISAEPQGQTNNRSGNGVVQAGGAAPAVGEMIVRANLDDDPFSPNNFAKDGPGPKGKAQLAAGSLASTAPVSSGSLKEADQAFRVGQYNQAARLFEKASIEGARIEGVERERWGYSKLASLVDSFNQGQVHEAMIIEVDQAMSLSPKLSDVGNRVRSQVIASLSDAGRNSKGPMAPARSSGVEIRRVQGTGTWQAVESAWFRVFYQGGEETAAEVARQADLAKAAASQRWLGHSGESWPYRCDIWLYPTGEIYSKATGVPGSSPGHSTFKAENNRVLERKIELRMDHSNLIDAVLPHEVTHVVLAGQFGKNFLPRWLDEGMAILAEPQARIRRHTDHIPRYATEGTLLGAGQLMNLADYPEASKVGIFYAQSVSVVDYLCSKKGTQAFTVFVKDAIHGDWEGALRKHYSINGFEELDRQWRGEWVAAGR